MNSRSPASPTPSVMPYVCKRPARSVLHPLRQGTYRVWQWNEHLAPSHSHPLLVLCHGWMDVGASFQFVVDELPDSVFNTRSIVALDWRGFGHSTMPATDSYWFPDYVADLDALLDRLAGETKVDLLGHSMGGNVVMTYAGTRPERVGRLINLEGFGLPKTKPEEASKRMRQWLDELKEPQRLRDYASLDEVATRLTKNNPLLSADRAAWLAPHWAELDAQSNRWHILGDPAHKRTNPVPYRVDEHLATWAQITAPLLWMEGADTDLSMWWGSRYSKDEFHARLSHVRDVRRERVPSCGHMLHFDQPATVARVLGEFLASTALDARER